MPALNQIPSGSLWLVLGILLTIFFLASLFYSRAKAWLILALGDKEVREDLTESVVSIAVQDEAICRKMFRALERPIAAMIEEHNASTGAHSVHFRAVDGFTRAHVAEMLTKHDEQRVAHEKALQDYARNEDLRTVRGEIAAMKNLLAPVSEMNDKLDTVVAILDRRTEPRGEKKKQ